MNIYGNKGVTVNDSVATNMRKVVMTKEQNSGGFIVGENFGIQFILMYICYFLYFVGFRFAPRFRKCFADVGYS